MALRLHNFRMINYKGVSVAQRSRISTFDAEQIAHAHLALLSQLTPAFVAPIDVCGERVHVLGQSDVLAGDPAHIMACESHIHLAVHIRPLRVMVHLARPI